MGRIYCLFEMPFRLAKQSLCFLVVVVFFFLFVFLSFQTNFRELLQFHLNEIYISTVIVPADSPSRGVVGMLQFLALT